MSEREPQRRSDIELITEAIVMAVRKDETINDAAARMIASQLHGGQTSALYSFASTGGFEMARMADEMAPLFYGDNANRDVQVLLWALGEYLMERESNEPVEGWSKLWLGDER